MRANGKSFSARLICAKPPARQRELRKNFEKDLAGWQDLTSPPRTAAFSF
jgi:hypothetical protein